MQSSDEQFQTTQESPYSQLHAVSRATYPNEEVKAPVRTSRVDEFRPKHRRASGENLNIHSWAIQGTKKILRGVADTILNVFRPSASRNHGVEDLHRPSLLSLEHGQSGTPSSTPGRQLVDGSRFWAVLIGIDAYQRNPLRGCVSDALLIKSYLTSDLGMPEHRIQCLLGSKYPQNPTEPSRANIVDTLYSLVGNPEIERDDNIIIYYAGHGSSYCCSEHPGTTRCDSGLCGTEALCPIDRDTQDSGGKWTPDISDREIDYVISQICRAKGHRITFIVDCSFSNGLSRQALADAEFRSIHPTSHASLDDMLRAAHERWKGLPYYRSILSKDWQPDMDSHVVLVACQDYQTAREVEAPSGFNGVFTKTLVRVLRSADWKEEMTYIDLVNLMNQSPFQTPSVAGKWMMERLWCTRPQ